MEKTGNDSVIEQKTELTEQDAVEQIGIKIDELHALEKKNYRINRIRMICSILSLIVLTAAAVVLLMNVKTVVTKADRITTTVSQAGTQFEDVTNDIDVVLKDLEKIEFSKLGKSLQEIADLTKSAVEQINDSAGDLDKIVKSAETVLDNLSSLKIDSLNNGITELNRVLEDIKLFFNALPQ